KKFLRRNKAPALAAGALAALVIGSLAVTLASNYRVNRALDDRTAAYVDLEREQEKTALALGRETALTAQVTESLTAERREANINRLALADRELSLNHIGEVNRLLDECPDDFRLWDWRYLKRRCHRDVLTLSGHRGGVNAVAFGPGAQWI